MNCWSLSACLSFQCIFSQFIATLSCSTELLAGSIRLWIVMLSVSTGPSGPPGSTGPTGPAGRQGVTGKHSSVSIVHV